MEFPPIFVKKVFEDAKLPVRAYPTDSGLDVFAYSFKILPDGDVSNEFVVLPHGNRVLVDTGIRATVGTGYEIQVRPRSGLAAGFPWSIVLGLWMKLSGEILGSS
jgi:dUTP pyrophosphatase